MKQERRKLKTAAIFAGIGGIELGLEKAGHETIFMCENDEHAQKVLKNRFKKATIFGDVQELENLPEADLVTAGFPCQDISFIGSRLGLDGKKSGLIGEVFRLISKSNPELVLLENVSNLLRLNKGGAMITILHSLEDLGYKWAYRLVDSRGFGLPQRRLRVIILASKGTINPQDILLAHDEAPEFDDSFTQELDGNCFGFYWTEGRRGVGWAKNAVPTIKGGSGLGIPSPPAIFDSISGITATPDIEDSERMQGFPAGFTEVFPDGSPTKIGHRWKMVGNAVSVPIAEWIGHQLADPEGKFNNDFELWSGKSPMPRAAFGSKDKWYRTEIGTHPLVSAHTPIRDFLTNELKPLSIRALKGYISRVKAGNKKLPDAFINSLEKQLKLAEIKSKK